MKRIRAARALRSRKKQVARALGKNRAMKASTEIGRRRFTDQDLYRIGDREIKIRGAGVFGARPSLVDLLGSKGDFSKTIAFGRGALVEEEAKSRQIKAWGLNKKRPKGRRSSYKLTGIGKK